MVLRRSIYMSELRPDQLATLKLCCRALDDKKAEAIKVLEVGEVSSITDYLIIASGTSAPHLRALTQEVAQVLKDNDVHVIGKDVTNESGWNVVDAFDIVVHLFLPETRDYFRLDSLWKDATEISLERLLPVESRS